MLHDPTLYCEGFRLAEFSPDRQYRYVLVRRWARDSMLACIGLNPSTADESVDDPTVRRWVGFARRQGFGGIVVGNLYGYRATDPRALWSVQDPVGPGNDAALRRIGAACRTVLVSWGAVPRCRDRVYDVMALLRGRNVVSLGRTKAGWPRHPLYCRADEPLRRWP